MSDEAQSKEREYPLPLGPRILVKLLDPQVGEWRRGPSIAVPPTTSASELMQRDKPQPARGIVVCVGPGALMLPTLERVPPEVRVGEEILFYEQAATPIDIDGETLLLMSDEHVLVILSPPLERSAA